MPPADSCPDHDSLQALIERVAALDRLFSEQLAARDRAQEVVAVSLNEFKKAVNEWRGALQDVTNTRLSIDTYNARHRELEQKIEALGQRAEDRAMTHMASDDRRFDEQGKAIEEIRSAVVEMQGKSHGIETSRVWISAAIGAAVALIGVAIALLRI